MTINDTLLIDEVSADVQVLDAFNTGHPGVVHSPNYDHAQWERVQRVLSQSDGAASPRDEHHKSGQANAYSTTLCADFRHIHSKRDR